MNEKPLKRLIVAFCNIEEEIYAKAKQQATDFVAENSSEDEDDGWDESGHGGPMSNGEEFEFDDDIDLASPFLHGILSDKQLVPNFEDTTFRITTGNIGTETRNHEPSEDDWENMW